MADPSHHPPRVADREGIRYITFDRPRQRNAVTPADLRAATEAIHTAEDVRALVFTGAGENAFCAGLHRQSLHGLGPRAARALITQVRDFLHAARTTPLPTAAMINGHCIGVGFELVLACDLRIAVPTAGYGLPEVAVGVPSIADAALLQQHVGLGLAKEMILTGDIYSTEAVAHTGLLNRIVTPEALHSSTLELLARITRHSPTVLAGQKRLFEVWQNTTLRDGADASLHEFTRVFEDPDPSTGPV